MKAIVTVTPFHLAQVWQGIPFANKAKRNRATKQCAIVCPMGGVHSTISNAGLQPDPPLPCPNKPTETHHA